MIVHPLTGEVVPDELGHLEGLERVIDAQCREDGWKFSFRRTLRERIAELRGPAVLPKPRFRTDKQHRVGFCPRCSGRVDGRA